jgi:hypothetical protein
MFKKLSKRVKFFLAIQVLCMLVGTSTHVLWVINHGLTYSDPRFSMYTTIFWNSLTFLDPLAACLLLASPKNGVLLTAAIIITDVVHNAFVANSILPFSQTTLYDWFFQNQFLVLQGIFCIFVLSTLKLNLNEIKATQIG